MPLDKKRSAADILREGQVCLFDRKKRGKLLQLIRTVKGNLQDIEKILQHDGPQDGSNAPPE